MCKKANCDAYGTEICETCAVRKSDLKMRTVYKVINAILAIITSVLMFILWT